MNGRRSRQARDALLAATSALREQRHLLLDSVILGIVGALGAQVFILLLRLVQSWALAFVAGYQSPGLPTEGGGAQVIGAYGLWLIPIVTTLGGLVSGILVYSLAPEAEGHGTDAAVSAFHRAGGFIRPIVAPVKLVASVITIGSGGAAGREGPTALFSAGFGSMYATLTHRSESERRLLVLMGMAAGLSAIFRSPIGTGIFAVEVLYGGMDIEAGALLYTMLAAVIAYGVNGLFVGYAPLFQIPPDLPIPGLFDYGWYIGLGLLSGLVAALLPNVFYRVRDLFKTIPLPPHVKPAIGGLVLGLMALELPQVLGGGYGWIQLAIDGKLALEIMFILIFAKMLAMAFTVSSGGSGGVFAPSLFVGAMLGGFLSGVTHQPTADFVVVGMAAVFGGAARVPLATLLMVTEMTGGYRLLVPAALAVMLSYLLQSALCSRLKYKSLYEAQVRSRADSPAHQIEQVEAVIHLLGTRGLSLPMTISHLDFRALLASGIPIDLPDGKQLILAGLKPKSPCIGKPVQQCVSSNDSRDAEVVAIFRQEHLLLPHPNAPLMPTDRLLFIASPQAWTHIEPDFTRLGPKQSGRRPPSGNNGTPPGQRLASTPSSNESGASPKTARAE